MSTETQETKQAPRVVNGKVYNLWNQFVDRKAEWIGSILEDPGDAMDAALGLSEGGPSRTTITDITLEPNGKDSAMFHIVGENFSCGFDVGYGGLGGGNREEGWINFSGYGGHSFRIKNKEAK